MIIPATFAYLGSIDPKTKIPNYEIRFKKDKYGACLGMSKQGTRDILIAIDGTTFSAKLSRSNHIYIYTLANFQDMNGGDSTKVGNILYQKLVLSRGDQAGLSQSISIELEVASTLDVISDPTYPALDIKVLLPLLMPSPRTNINISGDQISKIMPVVATNVNGGMFGDAESNRRVELFAMKVAQRFYAKKGWETRDVSHENLGYDIKCIRLNEQLLVEVKGSRGDSEQFIITANEVRASELADFELCIVSLALSDDCYATSYTGAEFRKLFLLTPLQYKAIRKKSN